jgi:nitrite reductase/ring-hydroxylating ferredoxin subunit/uncharacterized membrane protein
MLKSLLQGKPLRHPLHPALVHFPIGLFLLSLGLDLLSYFNIAASDLFRPSFYVMAFGVGAGLLALAAGFADRADIRLDHPARKTVNLHMALNLSAVALFAINLFLRFMQPALTEISLVHLLLSAAGVGMILFSGYLGGTMVYDDGVGVGRHRRYTRMPLRTIRVSNRTPQDGWLPVCDDSELQEGATLRVVCDGDIIAIAKQGGEVYAFQEFCTHRYGPLSEGKIQDHQVMCPWHRSCFDIRTGKVTQGPAKVDLKTYTVSIRTGKIFIK